MCGVERERKIDMGLSSELLQASPSSSQSSDDDSCLLALLQKKGSSRTLIDLDEGPVPGKPTYLPRSFSNVSIDPSSSC